MGVNLKHKDIFIQHCGKGKVSVGANNSVATSNYFGEQWVGLAKKRHFHQSSAFPKPSPPGLKPLAALRQGHFRIINAAIILYELHFFGTLGSAIRFRKL
jgi:hypothetical protein